MLYKITRQENLRQILSHKWSDHEPLVKEVYVIMLLFLEPLNNLHRNERSSTPVFDLRLLHNVMMCLYVRG